MTSVLSTYGFFPEQVFFTDHIYYGLNRTFVENHISLGYKKSEEPSVFDYSISRKSRIGKAVSFSSFFEIWLYQRTVKFSKRFESLKNIEMIQFDFDSL